MSKAKKVEREFEVSDELRQLAEKVIKNERMDLGNARVEYLVVSPNVSKTVAGKCIKTGKELKFFSSYDYLIEMSGELWNVLDDETKYVLMQHELMHIHPVIDKEGNYKYEIRKHDIEDFSVIIKKHGIDWIDKVKLSISSIYDLDPSQTDKIQI